jgi:hypothetical protein
VHITWHEAQIYFGDLTPYLNYDINAFRGGGGGGISLIGIREQSFFTELEMDAKHSKHLNSRQWPVQYTDLKGLVHET